MKKTEALVIHNNVEEKKTQKPLTIYQQTVVDNDNEEQTIIHVIVAKEGSEAGKELNQQTIDYLRNQIITNPNNSEFPIVKKMKKYLSSTSKDLFEEPRILESNIEIKDDKIIQLKQEREIKLKKCLVDELGVTGLYSNRFQPKCTCYIDDKKLKFEIAEKIKSLTCNVSQINEMNLFQIRGNKACENQELLKDKKILHQSIDSGEFAFDISIPVEEVQLSETAFKTTRKENSKTNNIIIEFPIQSKVELQEIDID